MIQGLSAAGEQASSISISLEHANEHQRAFTTSWTLQGTQFGSLLATAVFIPFRRPAGRAPAQLGLARTLLALRLRGSDRLADSPHPLRAARLPAARKAHRIPAHAGLKHHKRAVLTIAVCAMGQHCEHGLHDLRAFLRHQGLRP